MKCFLKCIAILCLVPPALGQTATCADGSSSSSQHRSGTCSHHGGVASWGTGGESPSRPVVAPGPEVRMKEPKPTKYPYRNSYCTKSELVTGGLICGGWVATPQQREIWRSTAAIPRDSRGHIKRSPHARAAFEREHPCPANGRASGSCHGYVIDHIIPLACGGPDDTINMQWQTVADGKAKDKWERSMCGR
jgi:Protein of unknown function (DUF3761)